RTRRSGACKRDGDDMGGVARGSLRRARTRLQAARRRHRLYAIVAGALLVAPPAAAELQRRTITIDEIARSYLLYLPDARPARDGGMPLVVALHGGGTSADLMMIYSRFHEVAERENFAVAYPYATRGWWNDGRLINGRGETDADDVGFIRALVADASAY